MEIIDLTIDDSDDDVRKRRRVFSSELIDLSIETEDALIYLDWENALWMIHLVNSSHITHMSSYEGMGMLSAT
jgi:hypothetical protein